MNERLKSDINLEDLIITKVNGCNIKDENNERHKQNY